MYSVYTVRRGMNAHISPFTSKELQLGQSSLLCPRNIIDRLLLGPLWVYTYHLSGGRQATHSNTTIDNTNINIPIISLSTPFTLYPCHCTLPILIWLYTAIGEPRSYTKPTLVECQCESGSSSPAPGR